MTPLKVTILALVLATASARPQRFDNFDYDESLPKVDDADYQEAVEELAERDLYDLNPQYKFEYKVADEDEQTYITHAESRDNNAVTGEYSYVDPLGSLIIVRYTADENGYQETREVQPNFVTIRAKGDRPAPTPAPIAPAPVRPLRPRPTQAPASNEDLIASIIAKLTPFIKDTVSNSLGKRA